MSARHGAPHPPPSPVSAPMTTFLGRFKESVDFGVAEDMLRAFVPICRLALFTFYLVPRGHGASPVIRKYFIFGRNWRLPTCQLLPMT